MSNIERGPRIRIEVERLKELERISGWMQEARVELDGLLAANRTLEDRIDSYQRRIAADEKQLKLIAAGGVFGPDVRRRLSSLRDSLNVARAELNEVLEDKRCNEEWLSAAAVALDFAVGAYVDQIDLLLGAAPT